MAKWGVAAGVGGGHDHRVRWTDASGDGDTHHLVDVALFDDEAGLAIVGAEHAALAAIFLDQRQQVAEVSGD